MRWQMLEQNPYLLYSHKAWVIWHIATAFWPLFKSLSFTTMFVAVVYEISSDTFNKFLAENNMLESGFPDDQKFLKYLKLKTSTLVHLAQLNDESMGTTIRHTFLCCYIDYHDRIYNCEEIMTVTVPSGFSHIHCEGNIEWILPCKWQFLQFTL